MITSKKFCYIKAITQCGYLSDFCEFIYAKYNFQEPSTIPNMPPTMAYEPEIWIIGSNIIEELKKNPPKKRDFSILLNEILKVIKTKKYESGRESFVMTLHYFNKYPIVKEILSTLLDDKQLYGFAIGELKKMKCYNYTEKINKILQSEKTTWIKHEAKQYLKKAQGDLI
ncbi:hypothetical protein [Phocaeicola vulgatus]|uniref:hypothetical protein n=1 Tax=Phocaeicola vulgatus TaxID=821 RepID=UPI001F340834|nr:hypothetical protein [Phocaeicola vulgatus]MCE8725424.1 hypothetical protein [Phocaeicola vulgatus]